MALGTKDFLSLSDEHDSDRSMPLNVLLCLLRVLYSGWWSWGKVGGLSRCSPSGLPQLQPSKLALLLTLSTPLPSKHTHTHTHTHAKHTHTHTQALTHTDTAPTHTHTHTPTHTLTSLRMALPSLVITIPPMGSSSICV